METTEKIPLKSMTLLELEETIRLRDGKIERKDRSKLKDALAIGRALCEVKRRLPHGGFQKWIKNKFPQKYSTLAGYMQIAKNWKHPSVQQGLADGTITSVESFIKALSPKADKTTFKTPQEKQNFEENQNYLKKQWNNALSMLSTYQIDLFTQNFDEIWPKVISLLEVEIETAKRQSAIKVSA